MTGGEPAIVTRARTALGRVTSHPETIELTVEGGRVTLSGPVLAREAEDVIAAVRGVTGVRNVNDLLTRRASAEGVARLQAAVQHHPRPAMAPAPRAPKPRFVTTVAGTALAVWGARRPGLPGLAMRLTGAAIATRGLANAG